MTLRARGGENVVPLAVWTDGKGLPLSVSQVTVTLIYLDGDQGGAKTIIEGPIAMTQIDGGHTFFSVIALPEQTYDGKVLYLDFNAELDDDGSALNKVEILWVDAPLDNQTMKVSF